MLNMPLGGASQGFSSTPPSYDMCSRFASVEYGFSGVTARFFRNPDQTFGYHRARQRGPQQVVPLVDRIGPQGREDEIGDELLGEVFSNGLHRPGLQRFGASALHFVTLTNIGGVGHHIDAVLLDEPFQDHRGVQPSGICQNNFLHRPAPIRSSSFATRHPPTCSSTTTSNVSSPATVPSTPGKAAPSTAPATTCAAPGGVLITTKLPVGVIVLANWANAAETVASLPSNGVGSSGRVYPKSPSDERRLAAPMSARSRDTVACVTRKPSPSSCSTRSLCRVMCLVIRMRRMARRRAAVYRIPNYTHIRIDEPRRLTAWHPRAGAGTPCGPCHRRSLPCLPRS